MTTAQARTGLDREALEMVLSSLGQFAKDRLGEPVLLDLDARDEMPRPTSGGAG